MRILAIVTTLLAVLAAPAAAQAVPDFWLDLAGGSGAHTLHTGSTYYSPERAGMLRAAATFRLGSAGAIRPVITVERASDCPPFLTCGYDLVCPIAPNGSCEDEFEGPRGNAVALGAAAAWSRYVVANVETGLAWYARRATYVDANASVRLFPHIAWAVDVRRISSRNARGERTWFAPISMGLRLY